ncbi:MOSC domain-containing protein [Aminipila sp.]|uniref:MOSC domain-containing protein n=1 Tax=Aminipila sp. TaxID=2060095 RepID=UPI00289A5832|nr:MOSC domain-containing protein [Aminipila sp.]
MQSGYVEALQIQRNRELSFENVQFVELEEGKGIIGDCHAMGGEKQIALISSNAKIWTVTQEIEGLCLARFQENIVTEGLNYAYLNQGDILKTNAATIEVTAYSKRCFLECRLIQENQPCELKIGIRFAKVVQSGRIQVGDKIWKE